MTSPKNEHAHITRFQLRSLDELAQRPKHLQPPLMQGIINAAEITVIRADAGVETSPFMYLLARSLATNSDLGPFVTTGAVDVLLLDSSGHAAADAAFLGVLQQYDRDWTNADTQKHLAAYHRHHEKDSAVYLDTLEGRNALRETLLVRPCTKVVILDDLDSWLAPKRDRRDDNVNLEWVLEDLAKRNIALVVFDHASKAGDRFCGQFLAHAANLIRLTQDNCAPTEIGGGFHIVRNKLGLSDTLPAKIQWWWAVVDGEFKTGWEWRDPESELSAKDIAIAERRIQVRSMAAQGMKQKEIVQALGIPQYTVSRDLAGAAKGAPGSRRPTVSTRPLLSNDEAGLH